jgi:hypothetical protein
MNAINKKQIKALIYLFKATEMLAELGSTNEVIENLNQITTQEVENVAKYMNLQYDDVIDLVNKYDI